MSALSSPVTYRPYLNRDRVIYVVHPDPAEFEPMLVAFSEQGFSSSGATRAIGLRRLIALHRPDVVMIDISVLRDEPDLIESVRKLAFGVRIFMVADVNPDALDVVRAVRSGAISIFVKPFHLTDMIQTVTDELRSDLVADLDQSAPPVRRGVGSLTQREREVLRSIVGGNRNKEVALSLGISPRTVEVHRAKAMKKLGAHNLAELIAIALRS